MITAIFLVLIFGLYGSLIIQKVRKHSEKKKHDRLAKSNYEQFKKLVIRFKDLTEDRDDNMQSVMQNIRNIPAPNPFSQINVIQPMFIKELYNFYVKRLNKFDGTKNDLLSSAKEFENMLYMYDMLYIKEPLQQIRIIGSDSVPKQNKQSFSKARQKYINFRMDYIKFAKDANEDFKEKEELGIYGSAIYFRDYFEQPDEL